MSQVETTSTAPKKGKGSFLSILLLILLGGLGYFTYDLYQNKQKTEKQITEQREQAIKELETLKTDYDQALETSGRTSRELKEAQNRISQYIDSLKTMKSDLNVLFKYKSQVDVLKKERTKLLAINDSLRKSNYRISQQRDSTASVLNERTVLLDSISQKNDELKKTVQEGAVLTLKNLEGKGIKQNFGGKYVDTERARAVEKLKICYTIAVNRIAKQGNRTLYVQVVNPLGVTLGSNETISEGDKTVNYSLISNFLYEKKAVDVCEFIARSSADKKFDSGEYSVKIFDEQLQEIGNTQFFLK